MKIFSLILFVALIGIGNRLWAQKQLHTDTLLIDLDLDLKTDSIFYERGNSLLRYKLSSQQFKSISSKTVDLTEISYIDQSANGFQLTNNWMRAGYHCEFAYNAKLKKVQLISMHRYAFGPANNDGSGNSDINLLTQAYEGNWNYYNERQERLVKIPTIHKKMQLAAVDLADFDDTMIYRYEKLCNAEFEKAKAAMLLQSKTTSFKKEFVDANGKNSLQLTLYNGCTPDSPPWDADSCSISIRLKNKKGTLNYTYNHPDPQMSLIYFVANEIKLQQIHGTTAVIIPFYYCGNEEAYDRNVSYLLFYKQQQYSYHLAYNCSDPKNCEADADLKLELENLPKALKSYFIGYLNRKHQFKKSFH